MFLILRHFMTEILNVTILSQSNVFATECCMIGLWLQYVLSGSDDFNLYVWKIPEEPINGLYTIGSWW